jgi:hypothetical protein
MATQSWLMMNYITLFIHCTYPNHPMRTNLNPLFATMKSLPIKAIKHQSSFIILDSQTRRATLQYPTYLQHCTTRKAAFRLPVAMQDT